VPVLVYVGATWCEPCRDFHQAATAGSLDAALGPLRFLEFDLDRDGERLATAGYRSELVPLFARPAPNGTASGAQTDGVKKGGDYVEQLTPRIHALVQP
jgi:thiol-disulfide isomerase/thioredoxin